MRFLTITRRGIRPMLFLVICLCCLRPEVSCKMYVQALRRKEGTLARARRLNPALLAVAGTQGVIAADHFYRSRTQSDAHKSGHGDWSVERRLDSAAVWNASVPVKNGRRGHSRSTNTDLFLQNGYTTHGLRARLHRCGSFDMSILWYLVGNLYDTCFADTQEKTVEFTILWLPGRFPQLRAYIFIIILVIVLAICFFVSGCCVKGYATYNRIPSV